MQSSEDRYPIKPLPPEVAAQIKSSTAISSLEHVTIGLFQNALDAGASTIHISVDFARGACTVEDDGWGINPVEFLDSGGLGKSYHTSKLESKSNLHGGEGTFLASLAAISILTITSHHYANRSMATLFYHHTRPVARLVPAPPHHQLLHLAHGTKVEVHDLFGNMPVRVKQRHSAVTNKKEFVQEWKSLLKNLVGLILAWHMPVTAVLKSFLVNTKVTLRRKMTTGHDRSTIDQRTPKSLDIPWICSLLSQAGYIEPGEWNTWTKASARTPFITIRGAFSLEPAETKTTQFISLGIRHLRVDSGASVLYDAINHVFALSSFGNLEKIVVDNAESKDRRYKKDGQTNKQLRGAGKGVDRWPMFVIHIELQDHLPIHAPSGQDILEKESMLASIIKVLEAMTTTFLSDNYFRPRARRKRRRPMSGVDASDRATGQGSSRVTREVLDTATVSASGSEIARPGSKAFSRDLPSSTIRIPVASAGRDRYHDDGFRSWSRIKTGTTRGVNCGSLVVRDERKESENGPAHGGSDISVPTTLTPSSRQKPPNMDIDCVEQEHTPSLAAQELATDRGTENIFPWTNPITKDTVWVNARTGLVVSSRQKPSTTSIESDSPGGSQWPSIDRCSSSNRLTRCTSAPTLPNPGSWVSNFLKGWENPVFAPAREQDIPQVSFRGIDFDNSCRTPGQSKRSSHFNLDNVFSDTSSALSAKLSKASLAQAKIISQVDKKFILALIKPTGPKSLHNSEQSAMNNDQRILVLIDQHAADERIRVENLLADLCVKPSHKTIDNMSAFTYKPAIATALLPKPLIFQIKSQEHQMFGAQVQHFANWGILYDLSSQPGSETPKPSLAKSIPREYRISVKALPPVIAERCRLEPKLLIDLLRKDIWKREEEGLGSVTPTTITSPPDKRPQRVSDVSASVLPKAEDDSVGDDTGDWLTRISTCPRGILDMLNSRSCRSAIMFNDELSREECEMLVRRLAGCRFPFQCAHGRPSMVPLVGLGGREGDEGGDKEGIRGVGGSRIFGGTGLREKEKDGGEDFASAWKKWRKEEENEGQGEGE